MSKFSCLQGNEGYDACGDAVPPRPPKEKDILPDVLFLFCIGNGKTCFFLRFVSKCCMI